jgi:hypothetical protein
MATTAVARRRPSAVATPASAEAEAAQDAPAAAIQIRRVDREQLIVPIIGTAPLIVHAWSEKAKRKMLDAQMGKRNPKEARVPEEEYMAAYYYLPDPDRGEGEVGRTGFPILAFKAATVGAARYYGRDVKMTELRQFLFFDGELDIKGDQKLAEIHGESYMREDVARLSGAGSTEMRFRPCYREWTAELSIMYVQPALTRESVLSLIDAGGMGVGVGEWRPEKRGDFGTYMVDPSREVVAIR